MRLLADECCDAALVAALRTTGHDVRYVAEDFPGATDQVVLDLATRENRILLTEDKDFGELAVRSNVAIPGIVLIRIDPRQAHQKNSRVLALIERFGRRLMGHHVVVHPGRFRFRPISHE